MYMTTTEGKKTRKISKLFVCVLNTKNDVHFIFYIDAFEYIVIFFSLYLLKIKEIII